MLADAAMKEALQNTKILATAPDSILTQLANALEEVAVKAGQAIVKKGDPGTAMYIVAEGQMRVHEGDLFLNHLLQEHGNHC